jgi:hypothetical protein
MLIIRLLSKVMKLKCRSEFHKVFFQKPVQAGVQFLPCSSKAYSYVSVSSLLQWCLAGRAFTKKWCFETQQRNRTDCETRLNYMRKRRRALWCENHVPAHTGRADLVGQLLAFVLYGGGRPPSRVLCNKSNRSECVPMSGFAGRDFSCLYIFARRAVNISTITIKGSHSAFIIVRFIFIRDTRTSLFLQSNRHHTHTSIRKGHTRYYRLHITRPHICAQARTALKNIYPNLSYKTVAVIASYFAILV